MCPYTTKKKEVYFQTYLHPSLPNFRYVQKLANQLFNGDNHQAAFRILSDFRKGKFGWMALERPLK